MIDRRPTLALALALCLVAAAGAPVAAAPRRSIPAFAGDDAAGEWHLTFADEFDGDALDASNWGSGFGWGNESRSTYGYCDPDNNRVASGVLEQRIERRAQGGQPFSVGCINSRRRFSQLYGYWEARLRMPGCRGGRGAFWAKPDDESWPPELDVVEVYGDRRQEAELTIHWWARNAHRKSKGEVRGIDFTAGYHVFGAEWSPTETIWRLDGVEVHRTGDGHRFLDDGGPFYTMLEAQVVRRSSRCGVWPYYSSQYVDYVRIWERTG